MEVFNLQVPLGSARTQELPPLQMDPAVGTLEGVARKLNQPSYHRPPEVRSFYIHSADALPPPPGLGGLEADGIILEGLKENLKTVQKRCFLVIVKQFLGT